ncbi:bestrophin-like domain [Streptomyces sp. SYSU K21746]
MSEWIVLSLAMAAACAVVLTIAVINNRLVSEDDDPSETPDVIEYMTMMIGVVYAIVLGLAIAGVWEARSAAQEYVRQEAQALHEVHARSEVYPPAVRARIRADVDAYVTHVVDTEWKVMAEHGRLTERGTELLQQVRRDVTDYEPRTDHEGQAYQPLVDQVAAADDARGSRGESVGATMPGVVWFGLIAGALVTVGLIFTLQIRRSFRELLLAGLFSALIAFLLFLIWNFDAPYGRDVSAPDGPFAELFPFVRDHVLSIGGPIP